MPIVKKKAKPALKAVAKKSPPKKAIAKRSQVVDDDDEEVSQRGPKVGRVGEGWGGAEEIARGSDFIKNVDWKNDSHKAGDNRYHLVSFLEDAPYASLSVHWLERKGKRSFVCIGDDCPLCAAGDDPKAEYRFNVAVYTDGDPVVRSLNCGVRLYKKIKSKAEAPLTKPLPKKRYVITRSGKSWNEISYDLDVITDSEIEDGYPNFYVPTKAELSALDPYTISDVEKEYSSLEELEEMAVELAEGEA